MTGMDAMDRILRIRRLLNTPDDQLFQEERDEIEVWTKKRLAEEERDLSYALENTYCIGARHTEVVEELYKMLANKLGLGVTWQGQYLTVRWGRNGGDDLVQVQMMIAHVDIPEDYEEEVPV